ncbi:GTPase [Marinobacteraceae bacterium S3BR75-40.1]
MVGITDKPDLTLPEQKLASLSFCEATPKAFKDWVRSLPMANIGETSRRLYHAVIELNQLILAPQQRMALLELVRQPVYFVCGELSRHYLGQSIALPEKQRKIANLAQAMQLHLAGGYKICLMEMLEHGPVDKAKKPIAQACHRIITDLSATVLRSCQLYCPSPANSWYESHQVYRFVYNAKLADYRIHDETNRFRQETSIADTYKRLALLGCSRPNQLRQTELTQIFELYENWTEYADVSPEHVTDALFVINTERDGAPIYRSLVSEAVSGAYYGFDTSELAERLTETIALMRQKPLDEETPLKVPGQTSEALLMHLSQALGILTKRSFKRIASSGSLQVCVGMSALHYYCAGETDFNHFLMEHATADDDENVFLSKARRKEDAWAGALDAGPNESMVSADTPINFRGASGNVENGQERKPSYQCHRISLVNTSPGGYCLSWDDAVPPSLQAGEILGVREQSDHPWSIAVIRWIRQVRQQGTQVGVELLAPNAGPTGVRLIQKVGKSSEFLRGLLLPELNSIGQPATLITPRLPFQTGNRIVLFHNGREEQCQLSRRISATGSISQFELKYFGRSTSDSEGADGKSKGASQDEFDSLWPSL